ncbi:MAG: hypothetical protein ISS25_03010 [Nanoarchaeota archaeon]|nr:hypothetical protein [DPANN group archaeon]MBL7116770.1 hypothetical protein [Nanoarchaeota archaeon]
MNKMNKVMAWFLAALIFSSFAYAYEIVGDSVLYTGQYADLKVTPHTAWSPVNDFEQTFTVTNNVGVAGDLCVAYYFDKPLTKGNVNLKSTQLVERDVWVSNITCDDVWDETNQTYYSDCVDNGYYDAVQENKVIWNDVTSFFTHLSHNGKHYYYSNTPLSFASYDEKSWKISYSPNPDDDSHKWGLLGWNSKSGNCYEDFISQNYDFLYDLDPWWNTSWDYSYSITPSVVQDKEIYIINISDTKCENNTNSTRIVDSSNTTTYDYVWHNDSKNKLAFVGDNSSSFWLYCDDDLNVGEGNNSNTLFVWMDCDGSDTDDSDWSDPGSGVISCDTGQSYEGSASFKYKVGGSGAAYVSLQYPAVTTGIISVASIVRNNLGRAGEGHVFPGISESGTSISNIFRVSITQDIPTMRIYDGSSYVSTGDVFEENVWESWTLIWNVSALRGGQMFNDTYNSAGLVYNESGTVSSPEYYYVNGNDYISPYDEIWFDNFFICKGICNFYENSATITIGDEQMEDLPFENESEARSTMTSAINNVLTNPVIYTDMQIYARYYNGSQMLGRFDKIAVSGNQRWAFNYIAGSDTYTNMWNLTSVFYVLEMANLTSSQITVEVETLINNTET